MRLLLATALVTFSLAAFGDTVVDTMDSRGEISRISIKGDWARFEGTDGGKDGYMLVELKGARFFAIAPAERTIIEFSAQREREKSEQQKVEAELKEAGDGPKVAGYATRKYEWTANGESCGSILLSRQAAKVGDIGRLLATLGGLNPDTFIPEEMRQGFRAHRDPCETARIQLGDEKISKLGFPMKILDPKGKTINEVVSIDTRPKLDGKLFELPKDYSRTTVKEMMEGMRKEMESARDKIEQMMKDMSPEERAQMQQMMKQFGNMPK